MDQTLVHKTSTTHGQLLRRDDGHIVLGLPETEYQLHLRVNPPLPAGTHPHIAGTIHARAKRVDIVQTGGRYIDPVYGRPRRIQGAITACSRGTRSGTLAASNLGTNITSAWAA